MDQLFDALGEPKRRQILELLASGEQSAGTIVDGMQLRGPISQPAVSQHLKVLRQAGLVVMRAEGTRRVYAVDEAGIEAAQTWLTSITNPAQPFDHQLDALATEVARGKRQRRTNPASPSTSKPANAEPHQRSDRLA